MDPAMRERTVLLAVSVDGPDRMQLMVDRVREEFGVELDYAILLSDPDHAVIDRYGLLNDPDGRGRSLPHPTTLVIDREGMVRWRFTEVDYRLRPENADIVAALEALR